MNRLSAPPERQGPPRGPSDPDSQAFGALIAAPFLTAAEARTGRTPGKALVGVKTRRHGGGPVGWRAAVVRRFWMLLPAVGLIPSVPSVVGELSCLAALVGLIVSMGRASDGRGFRSMPEVDAVRCRVVHDGWLHPHHERTVVLTPSGDAFSGRFGPHRVTLDFLGDDSEHRIRGLEVRVASSGMTTGRSEGRDDRIVDVTTGPGLGELIIDCRPQGPDAT